jgi:hypothetical protein
MSDLATDDDTQPGFFTGAIHRVDGLTMYLFVAVWISVAAYSCLYNGDCFLLIMPLIFASASVFLYTMSSSSASWQLVGAGAIAVVNGFFLYGYPI